MHANKTTEKQADAIPCAIVDKCWLVKHTMKNCRVTSVLDSSAAFCISVTTLTTMLLVSLPQLLSQSSNWKYT
jgi:hypothetical protein